MSRDSLSFEVPRINGITDRVSLDTVIGSEPCGDLLQFRVASIHSSKLQESGETISSTAAPERESVRFDSVAQEVVEECVEVDICPQLHLKFDSKLLELANALLFPQTLSHSVVSLA
jgi:hypothetical protein